MPAITPRGNPRRFLFLPPGRAAGAGIPGEDSREPWETIPKVCLAGLWPCISNVSPPMRPPTFIPARKGFALVVTMVLLVLMTLVAVGLLSLSAISMRSANSGFAMQEARANARLGLMIALGELQRSMGPDRRVSAPAGVLDEAPESAAIDGVRHPHWTAVWSTEWSDTRTPWTRDDNAGGLRDRRSAGTWRAREAVENYLVSGNEGGRQGGGPAGQWLDARSADLGDQGVRLVAEGSVAAPDQQVFAKRVPLGSAADGSPLAAGAYAYWVGDLGVKANVAWADAHLGKIPGNGATGSERLVHAQDVEEEIIADFGAIAANETDRLVSLPTLGLLGNLGKDGAKRHFHDITTYSRGVLANVRDGGLQRDLTAYLHSTGTIPPLTDKSGVVSPGITDIDRMAGPANAQMARKEGLTWNALRYRDIAPTFGLVRRWALQAEQTDFTRQSTDLVPPAPLRDPALLRSLNDNVNVYDRANLNPAGFLPYDQPNLGPVMVEGSMYYNLATYREGSGTASQWVLRFCMYPRVALWNPYNIELKLPQTVAQLFVNGNKQVQLKRTDQSIRDEGLPFGRGSVTGNRHPAQYRGTVLWTLPAVTLAPGETVVFSPARSGRYDLDVISNNLLSPTVGPDPARYYYQDMERKHSQAPESFHEFPKPGFGSGPDNYLIALKNGGRGSITDTAFDSLPLIVYANTSSQAGGGDELPLRWNSSAPVPVYRLANAGAILPGGAIPDVRTREGSRLRWWREHNSNLMASGQLSRHPRHFQSALIANWNPRAAYFCRTPWENLTNEPPFFYGAYTRDAFDEAVSWNDLTPRSGNGKLLGYPFGPPQEGPDALVLFEVPRKEVGIPSLGYLRHLKTSEFGWHPSYAIGNSLADPRVPRTGTSPSLASSRDRANGGWNQAAYGWAQGQGNTEYWAMLTRQILFEKPTTNNLVYDLSFELNHSLWDDYFLSTGSPALKKEFLRDSRTAPLPNGRIGLFSRDATAAADLTDFHRAASRLSIEGGFNVHSVSKNAWKALLTSTRDTGFGSESATPFPRFLDPKGGEWKGGNPSDDEIWNGFRSLSDPEIDRLAEELVIEVKRRAPFFGLADFVNRRLRNDATGIKGPVQAAIDAAGLNSDLNREYPLDNSSDLPDVSFNSISDSTRLNQTLLPPSTAWGIPGYLTQGDVMQVVGSSLRARSDSFVIRSYGESLDTATGSIQARAWCEAVVQRLPEPLHADEAGLNPVAGPAGIDFGRKFRLVSFRWLAPEEV